MEIEAKYRVDHSALERLAKLSTLGRWRLTQAREALVADTYIDTDDRLIWRAGYALRTRRKEHQTAVTATLKGLGSAGGAIHRREEIEAELVHDDDFADWPPSELRSRVEQIVGQTPLVELFQIHQRRRTRLITRNDISVAELSLDEVRVGSGERLGESSIVEVELLADGTERDLAEVTEALHVIETLIPEDRSKFDTAQELLGLGPPRLLTDPQRRALTALSERVDLHGRRATALLALDSGATQLEAAELASMSERRVRHWLAELRKHGLGIFRPRILDEVRTTLEEPAPPLPPAPAQPPEAPTPVEGPQLEIEASTSLEQRLESATASLLILLDDLVAIDDAGRQQLRHATRCFARGIRLDPQRPHVAARKAVLHDPPERLEPTRIAQLALMLHLSRRRMTTARLDRVLGHELMAQLDRKMVHPSLLLAALFRPAVAIALRGAQIASITRSDHATAIQLRLSGPDAVGCALHAQRHCDLWHLVASSRLQFVGDSGDNRLQPLARLLSLPDGTPRPDDLNLPSAPGLTADDLVIESAWKTFLFHFERMLSHEPGTRAGIDPEALHDMRVATRRMRVAAQVFRDHLEADTMRPHIRGMRRTGRGLGDVRDLDVFWENVEASRVHLPAGHDLSPLHAAWERAHVRAQEDMLEYLDSGRYRRFVERFGEHLFTPWLPAEPALGMKGEAKARRIRHVAPAMVMDRLADVLAYEEWVLVADREIPLRRYHRLRIAIKQLRYTLEYLHELLGDDVRPVIKTVKQVQSHLGDLQDAVVGCALVRDFLMWGELDPDPLELDSPPMQPIVAPDVAELFVHWQRLIGEKVHSFPALWREKITADLHGTIARLVSNLAANTP